MSSFLPSVFILFSGCLGFELLNLSFLMSLWHPSASRRRGDSAVLPLAPHTQEDSQFSISVSLPSIRFDHAALG